MKRKLFLLNAFLATSLLTGTVFNVISCEKTVKSTNETDETTEIIIKEKTTLIKQKIKQIIDDYTTNSNNEDNSDWIINISHIEDSKTKIKILKETISNMKGTLDGKVVSQIDLVLNQIIKKKIMGISQYVSNKLMLDSTLDLPNDFKVEIKDDFEPKLANFTSIGFMESVKKLLNIDLKTNSLKQIDYSSKPYQSFLENDESRDDEIDDLVKPDIFKINTNFFYTFNYAGINEVDEYKDVELLITGDISNTSKLKNYGHQQIQRIFNELIKEQVLIYDGNVRNENIAGRNYDNLNNKLNWDFHSVEVQKEVANIQAQNIVNAIKKIPVLQSFKFDKEEIEYELIDAINFSNENIPKPLTEDNNTINLVFGSTSELKYDDSNNTPFLSMKKEWLKQLGIVERKKYTTGENYYFNENGEDSYWDGGELNSSYVDGLIDHGKIKEFYKDGEYLIGYGDLFMPRITFANLKLSPLSIKTSITINKTGFSEMVSSLLKYFEALIEFLQHYYYPKRYVGYRLWPKTGGRYCIQWVFTVMEQRVILDKEKSLTDGQISFNWIMENIIYNLRAFNVKDELSDKILNLDQYWFSDAIPEEAIENFRTINNDIAIDDHNDELRWLSVKSQINGGWYFKFGPFKVFLSEKPSGPIACTE